MFKQSYPKFFDFVKTRIARAMLEIKNLLKLRGITNFKYKEILKTDKKLQFEVF